MTSSDEREVQGRDAARAMPTSGTWDLHTAEDTKALFCRVGLGPLQPRRHLISPNGGSSWKQCLCVLPEALVRCEHTLHKCEHSVPSVTSTAFSSLNGKCGVVPRHSIATCQPYGSRRCRFPGCRYMQCSSLSVHLYGVVP